MTTSRIEAVLDVPLKHAQARQHQQPPPRRSAFNGVAPEDSAVAGRIDLFGERRFFAENRPQAPESPALTRLLHRPCAQFPPPPTPSGRTPRRADLPGSAGIGAMGGTPPPPGVWHLSHSVGSKSTVSWVLPSDEPAARSGQPEPAIGAATWEPGL